MFVVVDGVVFVSMIGGIGEGLTVSKARALLLVPAPFVATQKIEPAWLVWTLLNDNVAAVAPAMAFVTLFVTEYHW